MNKKFLKLSNIKSVWLHGTERPYDIAKRTHALNNKLEEGQWIRNNIWLQTVVSVMR